MKKVLISQVDALFANGAYPIEFLFYFRDGINTKKFRNALKKISSVFWPAFGEYGDGIISFENYAEENFISAETVDRNFIIPESEEERLELYTQYRLPDTKRLALLKITQFKNGTILVPKMKHLAGDGYSYFYFLSSLAALTRHNLLPSKSSILQVFSRPHHRRTALKSFSFEGLDLKSVRQSNQYIISVDKILRKDVQSSIRKVAESKNYRISTNDILSAMAVKKLAGIQKEFMGDSIDLTIPIDVRRRVKDYGWRFFGNGIMLHTMKLKKDDIVTLSANELAVQIREGMPSLSKQYYLDYLAKLEELISIGNTEKFRPFDPESGYLITNISRLPVDKLNFGTGPPALIFPLTIEKNAAAVLAKDENFILRTAY
jgi:hypothetical protein